MVNYFKTLNIDDEKSQSDDNEQANNQFDNVHVLDDSDFSIPSTALNDPITDNEVSVAIKSLKLNKASGYDQIINEYLISTRHFMLHIYTRLFNIVLESGIIPEDWTKGTIIPIYKIKRK